MKTLFQSVTLFLLMSIFLGIGYPVGMTFLAKIIAEGKSQGDLIQKNGKVIGSRLIAQKFTDNHNFWGRPSAADYDPLQSGGSNLGPTSEKLKKLVDERKKRLLEFKGEGEIPNELLFASGSGLDPHISITAAIFQVDRILHARDLTGEEKDKILALIESQTIPRQFGVLGPSIVNVLELNLALQELIGH